MDSANTFTSNSKPSSLILLLVCLLVMTGCVMQMPAQPDDPNWAPSYGQAPEAIRPATAGVIQHTNFGLSLFTDRKAAQVGDILTVVLSESTASSKSAETSVSKDSDVSFDEGTVLGDNISFGDLSLLTELAQKRAFDGESESDQSNSLTGSITVTVAAVLPNGNLMVKGEKWLQLNRGQEYIRLRGIVRPQDISSTNSVVSTQLADVRIAYSGTGELANANHMGWASKFFNSPLWPF